MSRRFLSLISALSLAVLSPWLTAPLRARQAAPPAQIAEVENSANSMGGIINADGAEVRSGPGETYYATLKLDRGAKITVVGIKFDWLKIVPPEGSFCYVAKAYVDKSADGPSHVSRDGVYVRAGSALNTMKVVPLTQVNTGAAVQVIGEDGDYYKIKPPAGTYVYINRQFVDDDPNAQPVPQTPAAQTAAASPAPTENAADPASVAVAPVAAVPSTLPAQTAAATTEPSPAQLAQLSFDRAEAQFTAAGALPLEEQPLAALTRTYQDLKAGGQLSNYASLIADARIATLKVRQDAADQYAAVQKAQDELHEKQTALQAERQELEQRMATSGVAIYTAVGTLLPSSLQVSGGTLYRLTDPANGHTLCYVRADDPKYATYLNQFVGIKGDLAVDDQLSLRVLTPTQITPVDPDKVNNGVSAELVPPSLLTRPSASPQASANQ